MCIMSISQAIYTQEYHICRTKINVLQFTLHSNSSNLIFAKCTTYMDINLIFVQNKKLASYDSNLPVIC